MTIPNEIRIQAQHNIFWPQFANLANQTLKAMEIEAGSIDIDFYTSP